MEHPEVLRQDSTSSESDSNESNMLQISSTPPNTATKMNKLPLKRKRKRLKPEETIDRAIEDKLQDCARKNNLSSIEMKKLLRTVVKNDHVLALVKIQEELELALENSTKSNNGHRGSLNQESADSISHTRKFTRSTARALNRKPLPIPVLSEIPRRPEVVALITEDLHSDEEDEEYQPREEDYASDDDPNTTISDIDSQPRTPMTPITHVDVEDEMKTPTKNQSRFTEDGLFKLPHHRNDSTAAHQEEIIAKRTRSKVCLQETPIETIESKFIPPDITTDMYDFDVELDNEWKEFLTDFSKPLNTHAEEDDEADPEYVTAEQVPIDKEELRDVHISKQEHSDLYAELFNELFDGLIQEGVILEDIQLESPKKIGDRSPVKKKSKLNSKTDLNSPIRSEAVVRPSIQSDQATGTLSAYCYDNNLPAANGSSQLNFPQSMVALHSETDGVNRSVLGAKDESDLLNVTQIRQSLFNPDIASTPNVVNQNIHVTTISPVLVPATRGQPSQTATTETVGNDQPSALQVADPLTSRHIQSNVPVQLVLASNVGSHTFEMGGHNPQSGMITLIPVTIAYGSPDKNVLTVIPVGSAPPTLTPSMTVSSVCKPIMVVDSNQINLTASISPDSAVVVSPLESTDICNATSGNNSKSNVASSIEPQLQSTPNIIQSTNRALETLNNTISTTSNSVTENGNKNIRACSKARLLGITGNSYTIEKKSLKTDMMKEYHKRYEGLKELDAGDEPTFESNQTGFTTFQRKILEQQLRMHVQFIAQFFLQVYCHPTFWKFATTQKNMLLELNKHFYMNISNAFTICNLQSALQLITDWENELSINSPENSALMEFIYNEVDKAKKCKCTSRFPARVMKQIIRSPVFIYGHLLPKMPFKPTEPPYGEAIPAVDQLLAHSLHYAFKTQEEYERKIRPHKPKKVTLIKVYRRIARENIYGKNELCLAECIRRKLQDEKYNPVKYYFEHKKPPPYKHILYEVDLDNILPPEGRLLELPIIWQEFGFRLRALELERTCHPHRYTRALNSVRDYNEPSLDVSDLNLSRSTHNSSNITIHLNYVSNSQQNIHSTAPNCVSNYSTISTAIEGHIDQYPTTRPEISVSNPDYSCVTTSVYSPVSSPSNRNIPLEVSQVNKNSLIASLSKSGAVIAESEPLSGTLSISSKNRQEATASPDLSKGQKLLTDYFKVVEQKVEDTSTNNKNKTNKKSSYIRLSRRKWRRNYIKTKRLQVRRQLRLKSLHTKQLKRKIKQLLIAYQNSIYNLRNQYKNEILSRVFLAVKALEIYTNLLSDLKNFVGNMKSSEDCTTKKSGAVKGSGEDEVPKTRKPYRVGESLRQMLLPESREETNEKDAVFAMNFFDKVEETLCSGGHVDRYEAFQKILRVFNPQKSRAADLYCKMENLFLPEYPQLAEIFLSFLLPSEAIEIGKFFEHFMITNMGNFVNKLNIFFNKQPAQIKKVYGALGELANEQDVSMELVKNKILPLLKGNKFLVDWFLQTFETEKPNQSISNIYEGVHLKQLESSQHGEADVYETVQQKDIVEESTDNNPCQLKYINGGIYYGSRILLPVKLSFLASDLSKCDDTEDTTVSEPDAQLTRVTRSCVHGIRECAEKQLKNHLDKCDEDNKCEEDGEKDKEKYKLCDDITFKVHAARLNPALYQSPQPHHIHTGLKSKHCDGDISPKKQGLQKRRSPKKNLPKSPTIATKKSAVPTTISEASKAIGIAKKLKTLTNSGETEQTSTCLKSKRKPSKCNKSGSCDQAESSGNQTSQEMTSPSLPCDSDRSTGEPKRKQLRLMSVVPIENLGALSLSNCSPIETISCSPSPAPSEEKICGWTREEDKIILEEVKSGYDNENNLVSRLLLKLPHRNETEIINRHLFLMEVLTQLQGKAS